MILQGWFITTIKFREVNLLTCFPACKQVNLKCMAKLLQHVKLCAGFLAKCK